MGTPAWASLGLFIRESCVTARRRTKSSPARPARDGSEAAQTSAPLRATQVSPRELGSLGRLEKATSMARTCVMATVTRVLAELTVATAISTVACRKLYQLRKSGALPAPEPRRARGDGDGDGDGRVRVSVEREVATLYFRLLEDTSSRGVSDDGVGRWAPRRAAGDAAEDSPCWRGDYVSGVAAGEALGAWCATHIVAATFG